MTPQAIWYTHVTQTDTRFCFCAGQKQAKTFALWHGRTYLVKGEHTLGKRGGGVICKEGCTCGRHNPSRMHHPPGCQCYRHKERMPGKCICGHLEKRHDNFGCSVCDSRGSSCSKFHDRTIPVDKDRTFEREVARLGFIAYDKDMATCVGCYEPVKLGYRHSVGCIIAAKAHAQVCPRLRKFLGK